jgi:NADPH:quinone reductase-like Zn-dependent oxidoreductase
VDWKVREGRTKDLLKHSFPLIPGWDVSGIVVSTGRGVQRLKMVDEVYSLRTSVGRGLTPNMRSYEHRRPH